jgi:hypothetical protein
MPWDEVTPIMPMPGIFRAPPRATLPETFAPAAVAPPRPRNTLRNELFIATLVETRALKSSLTMMVQGASLFASVIAVLLAILALETGTSSPRSASAPSVAPAATVARSDR